MRQYKYKPREKRLLEIIVGQFVVIFIVICISAYIICRTLGYQIDFKNMKIYHAGVLSVSFTQLGNHVYVNGEDKGATVSYAENLLPGQYEIIAKKDGYKIWNQTVKLSQDEVKVFKNVTLFKESPEVTVVTDQDQINMINAPYDGFVRNPKNDLISNGYEIWANGNLVTRFSTQISNVTWFPTLEYIAYQQADEIRIIEKNGTNDTVLVKLSSGDPAKFLFSWDGSDLFYKDGEGYKKATIY